MGGQVKGLMLLIGKEQGFTLVEILLAVILIGLVVGIILPNFNQLLESVEQKSAQRQVVNLLQKLKSKAITAGQKQRVSIKEQQFIYYTQAGEKMTVEHGIKAIKLQSGSQPICFYPNGSSSGGQLLLITDQGLKIRIKIDKITGRAVVEELK